MAYYHSKYGYDRYKKKKPIWSKIIIYILLLLCITSCIIGYLLYMTLFRSNVWLNNQESVSIYIPSNSNFEDVKTILYQQGLIINRGTFEWVAKNKKYPSLVKPGRYIFYVNMNNNEIINMLRTGKQVPITIIFNNIRTLEQLARRIGQQIEADSAQIIDLLKDSTFISKFGTTSETIMTLFIPNTYELYWNTTAEQFIIRMYSEFQAFWTETRRFKAEKMEMTIPEVMTLASIVEKETSIDTDKPTIAGVYINRLKHNWLLQADPTLVYIVGDYSIRRVLNQYKKIDSPYNTYKYLGLPPGPICLPSISSIDAVLDYEDHDYLFFCAKDDMSGYHVFSKTANQHNINARKFHRALDEMNIKK